MWRFIQRTYRKLEGIRRYHGTWTTTTWTVECALQRLGYRRLIVLRCDTSHPHETTLGPECDCRPLSGAEVRAYSAKPDLGLDPTMGDRIDSGSDICVAILRGNELLSYCWYALNSIEPEHASDLSICFPRDVAYVYKALTLPQYRGLGCTAAQASAARRLLRGMGVNELVTLVISTNPSSLRNASKTGYVRCGTIFNLGPKAFALRSLGPLGLRRPGEDAAHGSTRAESDTREARGRDAISRARVG